MPINEGENVAVISILSNAIELNLGEIIIHVNIYKYREREAQIPRYIERVE